MQGGDGCSARLMAASTTEEPPPTVMDGITSQGKQFEKKSFLKAVQQKNVLVNHEVKVEVVEGTEMVEIPDDLLVNTVPLWEDFLEGRFLDPAPHVARIHIIVNKIWPLGNKNIKIDVFGVSEKIVKFQITDQQTRSRILRRGVWDIAGIPMILSKWAPLEEKNEEEEEVKTVPMWVTMKNVPPTMFSWKGLGFIASSVGKPVRLHPETELCSSFEEAKVFVNVNLTKPLPRAYRFRSKSGINANIEFTYPWVPTKCSLCGKWGHDDKECSTKKEVVVGKSVEQEKGGFLSTKSVNMEHVALTEMETAVVKATEVAVEEEADAVEVGEASGKESSDISGSVQRESTGGANMQSSEAAVNREVTEDTPGNIVQTGENWLNVSPGKAGRVSDKKHELETVISPSRFQLLADEEDNQSTTYENEGDQTRDQNTEDIEESEILVPDGGKIEQPTREAKAGKSI